MELFRKISRNRKKFFSLIFFFFLAISLPITSYFVTSEDAFDRRSEAASFNALVQDFEVFLDQAPDYIPGVIRLEFPEHVPSAEIERIIGGPRTTPADLLHTPFERVEYIRVDSNNMASEMAKYEMYYPTKSVDLDYIPHFWWKSDGANRVVPIDWNSRNHWYFDKIKLPEVWKLQGCDRGSKNCGGTKDIVVAVHDTGMAFNAPEVQGMNMFSHSSYNRNSHIDRDGHGTYVAGVIASTVGNAANSPVGMAHNLTIMPINAHLGIPRSEGARERSLYYAAEHANVINMSWGYSRPLPGGRRTTCFTPPTYLNTFFNHAYNNGVVVVAASGNTGEPCISYPASNPRVIAVGSTNSNNSRVSHSCYGSGLDFVAPVGGGTTAGNATWQQTFSCFPRCGSGSNLNSFSNKYLVGTSFASPQVAGAAGLILSLDSSLSPAQVKQVLIDTVDNIGSRTQFGHGLLNLENIYKHFGEDPDPGSPPLCGSCHEMVFPYDQDDHGDCTICAVGDVEGSISYPSPGEKVEWKCVNSRGEVDCWARREGSEKPVPENKCGSYNEKHFDANIAKWPSTDKELFCESGGLIVVSGYRFVDGRPPFPAEGEITKWQCGWDDFVNIVDCSATRAKSESNEGCSSNADCSREPPYEICFVKERICLKGDVNNDGRISMSDFNEFAKDFVSFRRNGWSTSLRRSDLNEDRRISMADYSIFVISYRRVTGLD